MVIRKTEEIATVKRWSLLSKVFEPRSFWFITSTFSCSIYLFSCLLLLIVMLGFLQSLHMLLIILVSLFFPNIHWRGSSSWPSSCLWLWVWPCLLRGAKEQQGGKGSNGSYFPWFPCLGCTKTVVIMLGGGGGGATCNFCLSLMIMGGFSCFLCVFKADSVLHSVPVTQFFYFDHFSCPQSNI